MVLTFDNKETVLELNGCIIEAFPSNHLDSYRALDNPKFILIDEADFFRKSEQDDVRDVSERYIGKSDPFIVLVSTPMHGTTEKCTFAVNSPKKHAEHVTLLVP